MATEGTPASVDSLLENEKNRHAVRCPRCPSVVFIRQTARHVRQEHFLPHMKQKNKTQTPSDGETLHDFWVVDDMFAFENVGFTNQVENIKYLICADCEVGPIGYHDTTNPKAFYIALERVINTE